MLSEKGRKAISKAAKKMWAKKKHEKLTTFVKKGKLVTPYGVAASFREEGVLPDMDVEFKDQHGETLSSHTYRSVETEMVDHPQHYGGDTTYEVIKVLEAWELDMDFDLGNAVKYIARKTKASADRLEDLKKAQWYLTRRIQRMEAQNENR